MWPDDYIEWSRKIETRRIETHIRWQYRGYPLFAVDDWDIGGWVARHGRTSAFARATALRDIPRFFDNRQHFNRWLLMVGYSESLRFLFRHPTVESLLAGVSAGEARLLRHLYTDQLPSTHLAVVLGVAPNRIDAQAEAAYQAFCLALSQPGPNNWGALPGGEPFPHYPIV